MGVLSHGALDDNGVTALSTTTVSPSCRNLAWASVCE
jgi:hypothetical protein